MAEQLVTVDVDDDLKIIVLADVKGPQLVAADDLVGRLSTLTSSIEVVATHVLEAVKKALPDKATVELSFGLAIENGQLLALLGKGKAEASITTTLEWDRTKAV